MADGRARTQFKKGSKRPASSGRRKGTPNRSTQMVREALLESFGDMKTHVLVNVKGKKVWKMLSGPVEYLRWLAHAEPKAYASLLGRVLPAEIKLDAESVGLTVIVRDYTGGFDGDEEEGSDQAEGRRSNGHDQG